MSEACGCGSEGDPAQEPELDADGNPIEEPKPDASVEALKEIANSFKESLKEVASRPAPAPVDQICFRLLLSLHIRDII